MYNSHLAYGLQTLPITKKLLHRLTVTQNKMTGSILSYKLKDKIGIKKVKQKQIGIGDIAHMYN